MHFIITEESLWPLLPMLVGKRCQCINCLNEIVHVLKPVEPSICAQLQDHHLSPFFGCYCTPFPSAIEEKPVILF